MLLPQCIGSFRSLTERPGGLPTKQKDSSMLQTSHRTEHAKNRPWHSANYIREQAIHANSLQESNAIIHSNFAQLPGELPNFLWSSDPADVMFVAINYDWSFDHAGWHDEATHRGDGLRKAQVLRNALLRAAGANSAPMLLGPRVSNMELGCSLVSDQSVLVVSEESHDCNLFRRYDFDKDFVAHARDPGKVAVMISRATHELILFHETRDDDFLGRLQNFLWRSRWTRGYSYETLNVDEDNEWTPEEQDAWQWQENEPWKDALSDSESDEDLHFAEIFADPAMRTLCELRENERHVRRATLPRYRPSRDVPADLWNQVQHLVFAKAVKAEQFDDEDSEEADETADVKISAVISLPMLPCNVRLFRSFPDQREMWDSVPTALAAHISNHLEGSTSSVQYHKAEVSYHGQHVLVAQRCRSFRPEAQIHHNGEMVAKIYFGMGTQANHWSSYNFVCFVYRTAALRAAQQALGAVDRCLGHVPER